MSPHNFHTRKNCEWLLCYPLQLLETCCPFLCPSLSSYPQHYDRRGQTEKALQTIDEAIMHTPTVTDFYMVKVSAGWCEME